MAFHILYTQNKVNFREKYVYALLDLHAKELATEQYI